MAGAWATRLDLRQRARGSQTRARQAAALCDYCRDSKLPSLVQAGGHEAASSPRPGSGRGRQAGNRRRSVASRDGRQDWCSDAFEKEKQPKPGRRQWASVERTKAGERKERCSNNGSGGAPTGPGWHAHRPQRQLQLKPANGLNGNRQGSANSSGTRRRHPMGAARCSPHGGAAVIAPGKRCWSAARALYAHAQQRGAGRTEEHG